LRPARQLGPGTQKSSHLQSKQSFFFSSVLGTNSVLGTQRQTGRQHVSVPQ
jgi:hypothetical protein